MDRPRPTVEPQVGIRLHLGGVCLPEGVAHEPVDKGHHDISIVERGRPCPSGDGRKGPNLGQPIDPLGAVEMTGPATERGPGRHEGVDGLDRAGDPRNVAADDIAGDQRGGA